MTTTTITSSAETGSSPATVTWGGHSCSSP